MDHVLIKNHNEVVSKDDISICLGDFCMGPIPNIVHYGKQLNGYKILIIGNHERLGKAGMAAYNEVFDEIYRQHELEIDGKRIILRHIPKVEIAKNYDLMICGHCHQHFVRDKTDDYDIINVGVDVWSHFPQTLETILSEADFRQSQLERRLGRKLTAEQANNYKGQ